MSNELGTRAATPTGPCNRPAEFGVVLRWTDGQRMDLPLCDDCLASWLVDEEPSREGNLVNGLQCAPYKLVLTPGSTCGCYGCSLDSSVHVPLGFHANPVVVGKLSSMQRPAQGDTTR